MESHVGQQVSNFLVYCYAALPIGGHIECCTPSVRPVPSILGRPIKWIDLRQRRPTCLSYTYSLVH